MSRLKIKRITLIAMFAALTCITSQIMMPLPFTPAPINLALLSVLMSGAILGKIDGALSQLLFVLLGAVGLPVFSGFHGGLGALLGPTGGFLFSYIVIAFLVGLILEKRNLKLYMYFIAMLTGVLVAYIFGSLWFMFYSGISFIAAITVCALPFIIVDVIKVIIGSLLSFKLRGILKISQRM